MINKKIYLSLHFIHFNSSLGIWENTSNIKFKGEIQQFK